jgi:hypothetical protein
MTGRSLSPREGQLNVWAASTTRRRTGRRLRSGGTGGRTPGSDARTSTLSMSISTRAELGGVDAGRGHPGSRRARRSCAPLRRHRRHVPTRAVTPTSKDLALQATLSCVSHRSQRSNAAGWGGSTWKGRPVPPGQREACETSPVAGQLIVIFGAGSRIWRSMQ